MSSLQRDSRSRTYLGLWDWSATAWAIPGCWAAVWLLDACWRLPGDTNPRNILFIKHHSHYTKVSPKVSYQISWKGQNIVNRIRFWSVMPIVEFRIISYYFCSYASLELHKTRRNSCAFFSATRAQFQKLVHANTKPHIKTSDFACFVNFLGNRRRIFKIGYFSVRAFFKYIWRSLYRYPNNLHTCNSR